MLSTWHAKVIAKYNVISENLRLWISDNSFQVHENAHKNQLKKLQTHLLLMYHNYLVHQGIQGDASSQDLIPAPPTSKQQHLSAKEKRKLYRAKLPIKLVGK